MTRMMDTSSTYSNVRCAAAMSATELGLITMDFDPDAVYLTRRLVLTKEGKHVAKRLDEINEMLSGK